MHSNRVTKIVDNNHYHLWTDALHARELSRQANNKWDRGTYVRWTVTTSWIVLEVACQDALNDPKISYSFKKHLNEAVDKKGLPSLDWGQGVWQEVVQMQEIRKNYVHRFISEHDQFPEASLADKAIRVIRAAVEAIYRHVELEPPGWIEDDKDRGWDRPSGVTANLTVVSKGVNEDDPDVIKIKYLRGDREYSSGVYAAGTDPLPLIDELIAGFQVPADAIRVYEGDELIIEKPLRMRGGTT